MIIQCYYVISSWATTKKKWFLFLELHARQSARKQWRVSRAVMSDSLWPRGLQPGRLLFPWDSPGKNTRVSTHSLLQGIFPTQGSNPGFLHCRQILYQLSCQGIPFVFLDSSFLSVIQEPTFGPWKGSPLPATLLAWTMWKKRLGRPLKQKDFFSTVYHISVIRK